MWYVQDPSSDFLRVNSKPNQTHQTLFLLAQQTLLPPEIPIHTLLTLAQSTQTRVVVGVARTRQDQKGGRGEGDLKIRKRHINKNQVSVWQTRL